METANKLGYQEVKIEQREMIHEFVLGRGVFVSLPLVCDAIHGRPQSSTLPLVLCILSPLVSLMGDQKETLE